MIDLTQDDWIREARFHDKDIEELRLHFNKTGEPYGWKPLTKARIKGMSRARLLQMVKDLEDCIRAGIIVPVVQASCELPFRGPYLKAPANHREE